MAKIKVITGGMKSGKSSEILRRYKRAKIAGVKVQAFKPDTDNVFDEGEVVSRDRQRVECTIIPAHNAEYILSVLEKDTKLVIIDEAQFFEQRYDVIDCSSYYPIIDVVNNLFSRGVDVVISGLDMDSDGKPFGAMPYLMAIATEILKLHAICEVCHEEAMYSFAKFNKKSQIAVSKKDSNDYMAVCPVCKARLSQDK